MMRIAGLLIVLSLTVLAYRPLDRARWAYEDENWIAQMDRPPTVLLPGYGLSAWTTHLTWRAVGYDWRWHHRVSLALHLLAGVLVYAVARSLTGSSLASLLAAALFLWHPVNSQAVSYLSARADLVAGIGVLLAVWVGIAWRSPWAWLVIGPCLVAALASKASAIMGLPLVLLTRGVPSSARLAWGGAVAMVGALAVTQPQIWHARELGGSLYGGIGAALQQGAALVTYLLMILVPLGFSVDHAFPPSFWWGMGAFVVPALLGAAWTQRHTRPLVTWACLWLVVSLVPRFVLGLPDAMAEHHLYVPFVGIWIALGAWMTDTWKLEARHV